jgi:hypothetical protein
MAVTVAPTTVTLYEIVKDLGLPAVFAILILFQLSPKLDTIAANTNEIKGEVSTLSAMCLPANSRP